MELEKGQNWKYRLWKMRERTHVRTCNKSWISFSHVGLGEEMVACYIDSRLRFCHLGEMEGAEGQGS